MTVGDMFCGDKNADKGKPEFWSESYSLNKVTRNVTEKVALQWPSARA